ncbi:MAG: transposase [Planctomycetes bacterium]|nr:transposase [Planctomycetota bacterium]
MQSLRTITDLVHAFRGEFSAPSFNNFSTLLLAWIMMPLKRTVTGLVRCPLRGSGSRSQGKHFSVFHRFFSRVRWELNDLGRVVVGLFDAFIPKDVTLIVDDTLCRRSGPRILGAGMFHDPLTSSSSSKRVCFSFGLNFVVLSLWIPASFCHSGGIAVPILFRLYRSKRTCPDHLHQKRTALALELLRMALPWFKDRKITVLGDAEYACRTLLEGLPSDVGMIGPFGRP